MFTWSPGQRSHRIILLPRSPDKKVHPYLFSVSGPNTSETTGSGEGLGLGAAGNGWVTGGVGVVVPWTSPGRLLSGWVGLPQSGGDVMERGVIGDTLEKFSDNVPA